MTDEEVNDYVNNVQNALRFLAQKDEMEKKAKNTLTSAGNALQTILSEIEKEGAENYVRSLNDPKDKDRIIQLIRAFILNKNWYVSYTKPNLPEICKQLIEVN